MQVASEIEQKLLSVPGASAVMIDTPSLLTLIEAVRTLAEDQNSLRVQVDKSTTLFAEIKRTIAHDYTFISPAGLKFMKIRQLVNAGLEVLTPSKHK